MFIPFVMGSIGTYLLLKHLENDRKKEEMFLRYLKEYDNEVYRNELMKDEIKAYKRERDHKKDIPKDEALQDHINMLDSYKRWRKLYISTPYPYDKEEYLMTLRSMDDHIIKLENIIKNYGK